MERIDILVVGGGSAGLAVSHELTRHGLEHLVVERGRIGQAWRDRWDSFCLVTPNWTVRLPGGAYDGDDPDGYLPRDQIAAHLERYAARDRAPVREGVEVEGVEPAPSGFRARADGTEILASAVVAASGSFGRPHRPAEASSLPPGLFTIDIDRYRSPAGLPPGRVLVVGSGQSGCQVAEELREAGRDVVLSCGRAAWAPRRIGGRDLVWWLIESGFLFQPASTLPSPAARLLSNPLTTGRGGGHDLHLRTLRAMGVVLAGRFRGVVGGEVAFDDDLASTVAWGDARHADLMNLIRSTAAHLGLPAPDIEPPPEFGAAEPVRLPTADLGAVVFTGGFRPAYRSWLRFPEAFDEDGFPHQVDGASTVVDGLFFVGTHFLRTRASAILAGVGDDAAVVARRVAAHLGALELDPGLSA